MPWNLGLVVETLCGSISFPYFANFDNLLQLPECWTGDNATFHSDGVNGNTTIHLPITRTAIPAGNFTVIMHVKAVAEDKTVSFQASGFDNSSNFQFFNVDAWAWYTDIWKLGGAHASGSSPVSQLIEFPDGEHDLWVAAVFGDTECTIYAADHTGEFHSSIALTAIPRWIEQIDLALGARIRQLHMHNVAMSSLQIQDVWINLMGWALGQVSTFYGNNNLQNLPFGVVVGPDGMVYVTGYFFNDGANRRLLKITPAGVATVLVTNVVNGVAQVIDDDGFLFFVNGLKIRKVAPNGTVTDFAGSGAIGNDDGSGAAASFNIPGAMARNANTGNLYLVDFKSTFPDPGPRIRKITPAGVVTTLPYRDSDGGQLGSITVDSSGRIYVVNQLDIIKIPVSGAPSTFYTLPSISRASLAAHGGNIYVGLVTPISTPTHSYVLKITASGVGTIIAGSTIGYVDGDPADAKFNGITGIAFSPITDDLYLSEMYTTDINVPRQIRRIAGISTL